MLLNLSHFWPRVGIFGVIAAWLGWTYGPVLFEPYAHHDDFLSIPWAWGNGHCGDHPLWGLLKYGSGRPLGASIVCWTNRLNVDFSGFAETRRLSFILLTLFGGLFFGLLKSVGLSQVRALLITLALFTLHWVTTSIGYGNNFVILVSAFLSFVGSLVLHQNLDSKQWRKEPSTWIGTSIICICFFIYQPPAMWPLVTALTLFLFDKARPTSLRVQRVFRAVACQIVAIGIYYVLAKQRYMTGWGSQAPLGLFDKYVWFFQEPLRDALSTWVFPGSSIVATISMVTILTGTLCHLRLKSTSQTRSQLLLEAVVPWVLLCLVPIPTMGVDLRDGSYRGMTTLIPFGSVWLSWAVLQILSFKEIEKTKLATRIAAGLIGLLIFLGASESRHQIRRNLVDRNHAEIGFLKSTLFDIFSKGHKSILLVQMPVEHMAFGRPSRQENELFDIVWPYRNDQFGLMNLVLHEMGNRPKHYGGRDYEKTFGKGVYGFQINGLEFIYVPRPLASPLMAKLGSPTIDLENKKVSFPQ